MIRKMSGPCNCDAYMIHQVPCGVSSCPIALLGKSVSTSVSRDCLMGHTASVCPTGMRSLGVGFKSTQSITFTPNTSAASTFSGLLGPINSLGNLCARVFGHIGRITG
jgi:hypothetical protein